MLITWVAFRAYESYIGVYNKFKTKPWPKNDFTGLIVDDATRLLQFACAMSMLVIAKAKAEIESSIPPKERKVVRIDVSHRTANVKNADTGDNLGLYLYNDYCGGSVDIPFSPKEERKRNEANSYSFDVRRYNIDSDKFKIGIGIHGQNDWLPSSFNITYTTDNGKTYTYADISGWKTWFNRKFWHAIPKRTFIGGGKTAVGSVRIGLATSTVINADANVDMALVASANGKSVELGFPKGYWAKGSVNSFTFDISSEGFLADELKLSMLCKSKDSWLPKSITVTFYDKQGKTIILSTTNWPWTKWFSAAKDSTAQYVIFK
jgi:hypothetical protein